jgi:hypothetical protein
MSAWAISPKHDGAVQAATVSAGDNWLKGFLYYLHVAADCSILCFLISYQVDDVRYEGYFSSPHDKAPFSAGS